MKKTYIQPTLLAVEMQEDQMIAASVKGNTGLSDGGSSNSEDFDCPVGGRVKEHSIWDEEW